MYTTSIPASQQFVADRRTAYEGVATRRRLRRQARRVTREGSSETLLVSRPTARIVGPRTAAADRGARKVA